MRGDKKDISASAKRILDDPVFVDAFDALERSCIEEMAMLNMDGSVEAENKALEAIRQLQSGRQFRRKLTQKLQSITIADINAQNRA